MRAVIVPNSLRDAIYAKLDAAFAKVPAAAITEGDKEFFYYELLAYFDKHGVIPDFELMAAVLSDRPSGDEQG